jgi:hypothetical protein
MKVLFHVLVVCLLVSASATFANGQCTLPPKAAFNGYSDQAGFSTDNHTYNPYTTTLEPYSGDPEPNANIYHEPKQPGDEPGHWARGDYTVRAGGSDKLYQDADLSAYITDGHGQPTAFGDYIEMASASKAPIYFGLTTSVLNDKIMPGAKRTISLGIYQSKTGPKQAIQITLNVKYWVSTGTAPSPPNACSTNHEFYLNALKSQTNMNAASKYMVWNTYPVILRGGSSGSDVAYVGPMKLVQSYSPHSSQINWTNTGTTLILMWCDIFNAIDPYEPSVTSSHTIQTSEGHSGWAPMSFTCKVAVAPPN